MGKKRLKDNSPKKDNGEGITKGVFKILSIKKGIAIYIYGNNRSKGMTRIQQFVCQTVHTQHSVCQLEMLPNLEGQQGSGFGHQGYKLSVSSLILSLGSPH